jgi:hypothetical protein
MADNKGSSFLKVFGVIAGIAVVIGIVVVILYFTGAFGGGNNGGNNGGGGDNGGNNGGNNGGGGDNGGNNGGNNGGGGDNGGNNGGNNGQKFVIATSSNFVKFDDDANQKFVNSPSEATKLQKEDTKGDKTNDHCPNFPDKVKTFRLKVPSKSGDKKYLRVSFDRKTESGQGRYNIAFTDRAGRENRWTTSIGSDNLLVSAAGIDDTGARNPGIYPLFVDNKIKYVILGGCEGDTGDDVRLVKADS